MIYTENLTEDTKYILVYDHTTTLDVIKLFFYYHPTATWPNLYNKEGWVVRAAKVLEKYGKHCGLDSSKLSARPIKHINDWEL